jgi:plasmid stabilization system protein ParE
MDYKVIFAPQAISRLEQIVSLIAADNPDTARRYGLRLIAHAELLAHFPD